MEPPRTVGSLAISGRPHGLEIIRQLTADSGKDGDSLTGWVMWAQLDWPLATCPCR